MEISIHTNGIILSGSDRESVLSHARQCVERNFARAKRRISRVTVRLDGKGDLAHANPHCMVMVSVGSTTTALAQGRDRNVFALVTRVCACAAQATIGRVKRRIGPKVSNPEQPPWPWPRGPLTRERL